MQPIQTTAYDLLIKYSQNSRVLKALWANKSASTKTIETPYLKELSLLSFSPDGQNLLIGDSSGTIKVLDWQMAQKCNIKAEVEQIQQKKRHECEY